jgi:hypothetical protein
MFKSTEFLETGGTVATHWAPGEDVASVHADYI